VSPGLPFMTWYPRDFRASTLGWPLAAKSVYRELLDVQWDLGGLPAFERELRALLTGATAAEWRTAWRYIEQKFPVDSDGKRRNARLELHRSRALDLQEGRRRGAEIVNAKRNAKRDAERIAERDAERPHPSPTPSPTPTPTPSPTPTPTKQTDVELRSTVGPVQEVFEHWRQTHKHPKAQLDAKRRRRIVEALKKFSLDQLRDCISGYLNSPHHMGLDPRGQGVVFDDIELFLRDTAHIETGMRLFVNPPKPPRVETASEKIARLNNPDNSRVFDHEPDSTAIESH